MTPRLMLAVLFALTSVGCTAQSTPPASVSPSGAASAASAEASDVGTPLPTEAQIPVLNGQATFDEERYAASGLGVTLTFAAPSPGWRGVSNWVLRGPAGSDAPNGTAIRFYVVRNLYADPLAPDLQELDPAVGPTADALVDAVLAHPSFGAADATDTTIGGYPAKRLTITIPDGVEQSPSGKFLLFASEGRGQVYGWEAGQTFEVYIVDVDGTRVVFDTFRFSDTPAGDLEARQAIIDSIELAPAP